MEADFCVPATVGRRSSTPTKAPNSPAPRSRRARSPTACGSVWTTLRDDVFVERLWKSVKYAEVYLCAYDAVSQARASIGHYLDLLQRPPAALGPQWPDARPDPLQTVAARG
jgi:putative transposase